MKKEETKKPKLSLKQKSLLMDVLMKTMTKSQAEASLKKAGLNAPKIKGFIKLAAKNVSVTGLKKKDGTLKKGFMYKKGGKIVKAKAN